ncbi:LysR family transcriptional regulator [Clostridium sp. MCC353]|uniref:LysR family transcriptional regulator n=1 Tax=Clostridium sp. MCC353 TaxID=2592646 RepID=UPI001C020AE3|nr:LysR family transcriptional regulator [Clostridium sp. MCC353]MBT9779537.1 LysR family transcriptional regulator [Clostridium sp. MCC353]
MDLKQIETVLAVAETLSFSDAAWKVNFSPSSVSKQVFAVENELGIKIFERKARSKVTLTKAGSSVIPYLRRIADAYNRLNLHVSSVLNDQDNSFIVSCPNGFSTLGEDRWISDYCRCYPEVQLHQIFADQKAAISMLSTGRIDAAFNMASENILDDYAEYLKHSIYLSNLLPEDKLGIIPLEKKHLMIAISEHHPAIRDNRVDLSDLKNEKFFFRCFRESMEEDDKIQCFINACRSENFQPDIKFISEMRNTIVFNMVASGQGIAPLMHRPDFTYPGVKVLPLTKEYYTFTTVVYYLKNNRSTALNKFINSLKKWLETHPAD